MLLKGLFSKFSFQIIVLYFGVLNFTLYPVRFNLVYIGYISEIQFGRLDKVKRKEKKEREIQFGIWLY